MDINAGLYVALEGVDGAGKTTCWQRAGEMMAGRGIPLTLVREPGGTPGGAAIREILLGEGDLSPWGEAALFAADRAELVAKKIRPALERGEWVLSDRSVYSSLAYQGPETSPECLRRMNAAVMEGVWPDLVILLEIEAERGLERQEAKDRISGRGKEFIEAAARRYDRLAREEPSLFVRIDGEADAEEVAAEATAHILRRGRGGR